MIRKHSSLLMTLSVYMIIISAILAASLYLNHGDFTYALDDPYIHMSMAKNLVTNGNWAVNQMDFSSSSSSPGWTLIISGVYYLFGVNSVTPFVLNVIFGISSILISYFIFKKYNIEKYLFIFLIAFIFLTPMITMLFTGMEHSAQITIVLLFIYFGCELIVNKQKNSGLIILMVILAALLTSLRYEDMFPVSVICLLLLIKEKKGFAVIIFLSGLLPLIVYGIISSSHGWYFLPNSILLKSVPLSFSLNDILKFFIKAVKNVSEPHIFLLLITSVIIYAITYEKQKGNWDKKKLLLIIFALTTILNMTFIEYHQNGWFYRYDAYLMALGIIAITINLYEYLPAWFNVLKNKNSYKGKNTIIIVFLILALPLLLRGFSLFEVPFAVENIYDQHYQISQFTRNLDPAINIAVNDIGMINFYSNNRIIDLWGLSDMEICSFKLKKVYDTKKISDVTVQNNVMLAVVYEHWFDQYGGLPASWQKIGEWTMTDYNIVCGAQTVSFYCTNKEDAENFRQKLSEYSTHLPNSVIYKTY